MEAIDDFVLLDATAQAELVRKKEVKPIELVEAAIKRIERWNPTLNAVVTPMYDEARTAAIGQLPDGPFTGVPFLLKDILASYAGVRMTLGSNLLKDFVPDHDSELVVRLKRAGLIIVGKTNLPELGILPTTEPQIFGPCRNPWDIQRTTGGSSGGAAAAVASGMVPMAHANDGGGSIRIPASCCGIFGLKPTRARIPLGPDFGDVISGLVCEHAVTRSVRDSAALLDATAGPEVGDPYFAPAPERPFLQEVAIDPEKLRIAFSTLSISGVPVHEDCVSATTAAAQLCEDLGHDVAEADLKINGEQLAAAFTVLWTASCASTLKALAVKKDQVEPLTWALGEMGRQYDAADYVIALQSLQQISRAVARFMLDYDLLLTPTVAEPPVPLGTFDSPPDNPLAGFHRSGLFAPFTPLANITGQPAMSVPLFSNSDNLPVGVHFIGRFGDEATLLRLAAQLEAARPWSNRWPPLSAGE